MESLLASKTPSLPDPLVSWLKDQCVNAVQIGQYVEHVPQCSRGSLEPSHGILIYECVLVPDVATLAAHPGHGGDGRKLDHHMHI